MIRTRAALFAVGLTCVAAGVEQSRLQTVTTIASFRSSLFMIDLHPNHSVHLRYSRFGDRLDATDSRCARRKFRSRNKELITLGLSRSTGHASTRKGISVWVRSRVTVRECLQESNDLVLFLVRQTEITACHVDVVRDLRHRPAVHFFCCSCRAVPGGDIELKLVACVVEVDKLLQAFDVTVMKELLLEVGPRRLGSGALRRCHRHIARRRHLHLAVGSWGKFCPGRVRVGGGTGTASEESS